MSALRTPPAVEPTEPQSGGATNRGAAVFVRRHPWWVGTIVLVAVSTALVVWAGTRPGYDPYGWLIWGYQSLHLSLDLGGAPSWKPMTLLFTIPYSLFGHFSLWLWMVTCAAISLAGAIFAARLAYRLTDTAEGPRYPAIAAGVFAGATLLGIQDYMHYGYMHYVLSFQSDPMLVTFVLAAVDCHLNRRYRWAFVLGVLTALGRPESWPMVGLYAIWLWRTFPGMRVLVGSGLLLIPVMWFGIPTITNHRPFVAGQLALQSPRELHGNKIIGVINRFSELQYWPVKVAAIFTVLLALWRRNRVTLMLAAGALAWLVVEIAFALHGWPAVPRYVFEPAAIMMVLAGVAVGWVLREGRRFGRSAPAWVAAAAAVALFAVMVPGAVSRARTEHGDLRHERLRTQEINALSSMIDQLGGYQHIRACGRPVTGVEFVSVLAWYTKLNTGKVGHRPQFEMHQKYPIVMFVAHSDGWQTFPWHTRRAMRGACAGLHAYYVTKSFQPGGTLIRR